VSVSARRRKHDRLPGGHGPCIGGCRRVLRFSVAWTVARGLGETLTRRSSNRPADRLRRKTLRPDYMFRRRDDMHDLS
jgi:hypothetical protein